MYIEPKALSHFPFNQNVRGSWFTMALKYVYAMQRTKDASMSMVPLHFTFENHNREESNESRW